jgi:predicted transcriptional regulator
VLCFLKVVGCAIEAVDRREGSRVEVAPPKLASSCAATKSTQRVDLPREQYRLIQYHFVQFFVEHLSDASRVFHGDLQEILVLAVIGQTFMRAEEIGRKNAPINASRISETTGIPRQTVRRKLLSLEQRGWIQQIEGGAWQLITDDLDVVARQDLAELDKRSIERILKFVRTINSRLSIVEPTPQTSWPHLGGKRPEEETV